MESLFMEPQMPIKNLYLANKSCSVRWQDQTRKKWKTLAWKMILYKYINNLGLNFIYGWEHEL